MMLLRELCSVIRSKNSGPFEITFDILFKNKGFYQQAKNSNHFNKENFAKLYQIDIKEVLDIIWFDPADGLKITMNRPMPSGSIYDKDIYGAAQHVRLLNWEIQKEGS